MDIHERPRDMEDLLPYLEPQWRDYITEYHFTGFIPFPYVTMGGWRPVRCNAR